MQWITVATPPLGSIEQFDKVVAQVDGAPAGLRARYAGTSGGKIRVVTLWESKAHADRFTAEQLVPTLQRLGVTADQRARRSVLEIDLEDVPAR